MRLRSGLQIGLALLGGIILIALAGLSFGHGVAAQPPDGAAAPQIVVQSVTSDGISSAHVTATGGSRVYYRNLSDGILTLTLAISGTTPLTLTADQVFAASYILTSPVTPWSPALTYTVFATHTGEIVAQYVVTQTPALTASLWVTFAQDIIPPTTMVTAAWAGAADQINVSWSGRDTGGSGIGAYSVEKREGEGAWTPWLTSVVTTESILDANAAHDYAFRVTSEDLVGNVGIATDTLAAKVPPAITFESATGEGIVVADRLEEDVRTIYFDNAVPGTLSVTLRLTGTLPLNLNADEVFGTVYDPQAPETPWTPTLIYTVGTEAGTQTGVQYEVVHNPGSRAQLLLDFVQDTTSPIVTYATPPVLAESPLVFLSEDEPLVYYGVVTAATPITIQGTAEDLGSGLREEVTATAAFGAAPAFSGAVSDWSFGYMIDPGDIDNGTFVVTAHDLLGHQGTAELPYAHDGQAPGVMLTVLGDYFTDVPTVSLVLTATDAGSGLGQLCLSMAPGSCQLSLSLVGDTYSANETLPLLGGDGEKVITLDVRDKVQNISEPVTETIFLDTVAPTLMVTPTWVPGADDRIHLIWSGQDPLPSSGLLPYKVEWRPEGGAWGVLFPSTSFTQSTIPANGDQGYEFKVTAFDQAGNLGVREISLAKKDAPTIAYVSVAASELVIAETHVGDQHLIYFDNASNGTLTLTLEVAGQHPASLLSDVAFGTAHILPEATTPWVAELAYTVVTTHGSYPSVHYTATNNLNKTANLVVDFIRDITPPDIHYDAVPVIETSPFIYVPAGSLTLYYGRVDADVAFTIKGTAQDAGSGIGNVTAAPALGTATPTNTGSNIAWAFEYLITPDDNTDGEIAVSAQDRLGHTGSTTLTYSFDGEGPSVTLTATRLSATSVELTWSATDKGSGIEAYSVEVDGEEVLVGTQSTSYTWSDKPFTDTYTFTVSAVDRVGNTGIGRSHLGPNRVALPLLARNYAALTNGTFDSSLQGWTVARGPFPWQGGTFGNQGLPASPASGPAGAAALLGNPGYANGTIPVGYGRLSQSFVVEQDRVQIGYHIFSYDIIKGTIGRYFDTFEIVVDDNPMDGAWVPSDVERDAVCVTGPTLNPEGNVVPVTAPGLAICGGRVGTSADAGTAWGPYKHSVTLDLSKYRGKLITLSFTIWSREYNAPERDDHGWYNTYVYIDDVRYVP